MRYLILDGINGRADVVVSLSERNHGVILGETHILQCLDVVDVHAHAAHGLTEALVLPIPLLFFGMNLQRDQGNQLYLTERKNTN